ncbi:DUF4174 domain-containing protein [Acidipila rosea]|uniref:Uncharacterized protein DUF4174 n=1 Tax=Acidipila rosea TaxID=768535 RepID=A0A4R1LEL7_9BACT|nr:DUF4174 domain-containing protein [Acidipila rosea]TCK75273.1 uncharacterized protein DUF4174 [Acidipila rosea]
MTARCLLLILFLSAAPAFSQAHPGCPMRPTRLAAMRRCYRPLLVFSPSPRDPRLRRQQSALDSAADDMMDRFVLLVPFAPTLRGYNPPLDTPYALLPSAQVADARQRFHVPADTFTVILLGEDGTEKLRSDKPVSIQRLNALIDSMPTRRIERQRPHAN